jgi:hypothetical protein
MTDQTPHPSRPRTPSRRLLDARQRRAHKVMTAIAAACAVLVLGAGSSQLALNGWHTFASRPAGVGASEDASDETAAAPTDSGEPDQAVDTETPAVVAPRQDRGPHHDHHGHAHARPRSE